MDKHLNALLSNLCFLLGVLSTLCGKTTLKATRKCTQELPQSLQQPITKAVRVLDFRSYHPVIKLWFFLPK